MGRGFRGYDRDRPVRHGGGNTPLVLEKRVYDASRRHGYEQFNEVCETVQAKYGTGGAMCR